MDRNHPFCSSKLSMDGPTWFCMRLGWQGTFEMDLAKMAHFDLTILIHTGFMVLTLPN
jgi:hypothetical protein